MLTLSQLLKNILDLNQSDLILDLNTHSTRKNFNYLYPLLNIQQKELIINLYFNGQNIKLGTFDLNIKNWKYPLKQYSSLDQPLVTLVKRLEHIDRITTTLFEIVFDEKFGTSYHNVEFNEDRQSFKNGITTVIKNNLVFRQKFYYEHQSMINKKATADQMTYIKNLASYANTEIPAGIKTMWDANKVISIMKNKLTKPTTKQVEYIRQLSNDDHYPMPANKKDADLIIKKLTAQNE